MPPVSVDTPSDPDRHSSREPGHAPSLQPPAAACADAKPSGPAPVLSTSAAARFRQHCWPLLPVILKTAQAITGNHAQAEDLAQDTLVKAMQAINQFQDGTSAKAWLLTILRRTHIDHLRAKQRTPQTFSLDGSQTSSQTAGNQTGFEVQDPNVANPADQAADNELQVNIHQTANAHTPNPDAWLQQIDDDTIAEALRRLPEAMRWTLLCVDVEQMPHAEAAKVLNIAEGTVKSRASRARAMLRETLQPIAEQRGWAKPVPTPATTSAKQPAQPHTPTPAPDSEPSHG